MKMKMKMKALKRRKKMKKRSARRKHHRKRSHNPEAKPSPQNPAARILSRTLTCLPSTRKPQPTRMPYSAAPTDAPS
eukprot:06775_4